MKRLAAVGLLSLIFTLALVGGNAVADEGRDGATPEALASGKLYWTDSAAGKILRANLDGSGVVDVLTGLNRPKSITLDDENGNIYWIAGQDIQRANLDGSGATTVLAGLDALADIALDVKNGQIYWGVDSSEVCDTNGSCEDDPGAIRRANLDGSEITHMWTLQAGPPSDIGLDAEHGKIYWVEEDDGLYHSVGIIRGDLDGSTVQILTFFFGGLNSRNTVSFALDPTADKMYWAQVTATSSQPGTEQLRVTKVGHITRSNLDHKNDETLVPRSDDFAPSHMTLDLPAGKMYWADQSTGHIHRANLDGSEIENVITNPGSVSSMAIGRAASDSEPKTASPGTLYWIDANGTIQRTNLDGSGVNTALTLSDPPLSPQYVTLDTSAGKLCWYDYGGIFVQLSRIQCANPDGSQIETVYGDFGTLYSGGLVMDSVNGHLYWVRTGYLSPSVIRRGKLDKSGVETVISTSGYWITGLSLDPSVGKLYWINGSGIQRANLDGSDREVLGTSWPWGDKWPSSIALDASADKVYWTDQEQHNIHRANLDASDVEALVTSGLDAPASITLDPSAGKMYWSDHGTGKIQRANLDGSNVEDMTSFLIPPRRMAIAPATFKPTSQTPKEEELEDARPAVSVERLYFVDGSSIYVANRDGSDTTAIVGALDTPRSVSLDTKNGKIYWIVNTGNGRSIQRANLNGSWVENVKAGLSNPMGLAVDPTHDYLYWADQRWDTIYRLSLEDLRQNAETLVTNLVDPNHVALDVANNHMYWVERDKIRRADLSGENVTDIHTGKPIGLALDIVGGKLYWIERSDITPDFDLIYRADLDGQNSQPVVGVRRNSLSDLALDPKAGDLYWTERQTDGAKVRRRADDRTFTDVITDLSAPESIAIAGTFVYPSRTWLALARLYRSTGGNGWTNKDGWLSDKLYRDWYGIEADKQGLVTRLDLSDNNLTGELPTSLGGLNSLERLDLSDNRIGGSIPAEWQDGFDVLKTLNLSNNRLDGKIPARLGNQHLGTLNLSDNQLTGSIPEFVTGNSRSNRRGLVTLRALDLSGNLLSGRIPPQIQNLSTLTWLDLARNDLSGSIPTSLGNLRKLEWLNLERNSFEGGLPLQLNNLTELRGLSLGDNNLSGTIPKFSSLTDLRLLYLDNNDLDGSLPPWLGDLAELRTLHVGGNQLSGSIPAELGALSQLQTLNLSRNQLSGDLPPDLANLRSLTKLNLYGNQLVGAALSPLAYLSLTDLYLSGTHNLWGECVPETLRDVQNNDLDDLLFADLELGDCAPRADVEREREALKALYYATGGEHWTLPTGWLEDDRYQIQLPYESSPTSGWVGVTFDENGYVQELNLANRNLTGPIPPQLRNLTRLQVLRLEGNSLSGCVPQDTKSAEGQILINALDAGRIEWQDELRAQLLGTDPDAPLWEFILVGGGFAAAEWFGGQAGANLGQHFLNPTFNSSPTFSIGIPPCAPKPPEPTVLLHLQSAETDRDALLSLCDLTANDGRCPWRNWETDKPLAEWHGVRVDKAGRVVHLELTRKGLSGNIPARLGNLGALRYLNLSHNQLSGPIPPQLGNLTNLHSLALNNNRLTGTIPAELGNLTGGDEWFVDLHLQENRLTGKVPPELASIAPAYLRTVKIDPQWDESGQERNLPGCLPPNLVLDTAGIAVSFLPNFFAKSAEKVGTVVNDAVKTEAATALLKTAKGKQLVSAVGETEALKIRGGQIDVALETAKQAKEIAEEVRDGLSSTKMASTIAQSALSSALDILGYALDLVGSAFSWASERLIDLAGLGDRDDVRCVSE